MDPDGSQTVPTNTEPSWTTQGTPGVRHAQQEVNVELALKLLVVRSLPDAMDAKVR